MKKILILLLFCLNASAATVNLAWDQNPESDLLGYNIYWGDASGRYTNKQFVTGIAASVQASGDTFFALTAVNTAGLESEFSLEAFWHDNFYTLDFAGMQYEVRSDQVEPVHVRIARAGRGWVQVSARLGDGQEFTHLLETLEPMQLFVATVTKK